MNKQTRQIIKWYNAGLTTKEIGKKLNKCGEYVRIVLVKNNIPRRNGLTKEQIQQIIKWYNMENKSTTTIGTLLNCSEASVRSYLKENNLLKNIDYARFFSASKRYS